VAQGYDVLLPLLDAAGAGVAAAAQDSKDVHIVGSVADYAKAYGAANVTVGSVVFAWETLGYMEASGNLCDGKSHVLGLADKGIEPIINATLNADAQAKYDKALADLAAGKINIAD
jgi:basic membrane protein A